MSDVSMGCLACRTGSCVLHQIASGSTFVPGRHMTDMEVIGLLRRIGSHASEYADCESPNSCTGNCYGCAVKAIAEIVRDELKKLGAKP